MQINPIKTTLFQEGDSLETFVYAHVSSLKNGDILVITSKICALAERRTCTLSDKEKHIFQEAEKTIHTPWAILTLMADGWCINAGIDESNAQQSLILLPKNPFKTAETLYRKCKKKYSLTHFGIILTDTRSTPLRVGTLGRAIGYAGFKPLKSYIGKKDLFNRKSRITQSNIVDALAGAAVCTMGEGSEQTPLGIISDAPVLFSKKTLSKKDKNLFLPPEKDIFSAIFTCKKPVPHRYPKKK
jgi:F420-0:gamma-glutamyl ligase